MNIKKGTATNKYNEKWRDNIIIKEVQAIWNINNNEKYWLSSEEHLIVDKCDVREWVSGKSIVCYFAISCKLMMDDGYNGTNHQMLSDDHLYKITNIPHIRRK